MSAPARPTLLVSGMLAATPGHGGATWASLQYLLGLHRLGYEAYFVEPVKESELPAGKSLARSPAAAYFRRVMRAFGLGDHCALLLAGTRATVGLPYDALRRAASRAVALLNLSGLLADEALLEPISRRLYLDLDPAFTQLWHAGGIDMRFAGHTHFATVGLAIGTPGCPTPTCGRRWIPTLPPVVLDAWPVARRTTRDAFTTVANWRGYGSIRQNGVFYGQKVHALRSFMEIPTRTDQRFLLALAIHPAEVTDLARLARNGWRLADPSHVAGTPDRYRSFIRGSKAELGITKSGYVAARCGWFSDRSACYLASGRPVLAHQTGFGDLLPTGEGLLAFETIDELLAGVEAIRRDYRHHRIAARALAEEYFDSDRVLGRLLEEIG